MDIFRRMYVFSYMIITCKGLCREDLLLQIPSSSPLPLAPF